MTPVGLQFYTSLAAAVIQLPILVYKLAPHLLDQAAVPMTTSMMWMLFVDGIFYHTQSVTAYYTMSLLSPVSQSVRVYFSFAIYYISHWFLLILSRRCCVFLISYFHRGASLSGALQRNCHPSCISNGVAMARHHRVGASTVSSKLPR